MRNLKDKLQDIIDVFETEPISSLERQVRCIIEHIEEDIDDAKTDIDYIIDRLIDKESIHEDVDIKQQIRELIIIKDWLY